MKKKETVRLRATITVEYEADPTYYPDRTPAAMAKVDEANVNDDPGLAFDLLSNVITSIKVEPV